MISFEHASLRRAAKVLFEEANVAIHDGNRVGVVGRNGCGKSSLFKVFTGELATDVGEIRWPKKWRVALMAQELQSSSLSALNYVLAGDEQREQLLAALAVAEAANNDTDIARCHNDLDGCDAWTAPSRAERLLSGLGFSEDKHHNVVTDFSGGWRVRLNLARALMQASDLLLLDEPTNHLDIDAIAWLEGWLQAYRGTLLLVSHDRDFLDAVTDKTLWFESQRISLFNGNYESALRQKTEQLLQQQSQFEKQQAQIAHMEDFVRRFKAKASKAKQAQSRVKALERMQQVAAVRVDTPFTFTLPSSDKLSDPLLTVRDANLGYGETTIVNNVNISIRTGDRVGVLGVNGAGKSTLLKSLAEQIEPLSGEFNRGEHLRIGYFAQHQMEALDLNASPMTQIQRLSAGASEQSIRTFLGAFNFQEEAVADNIHHFSGGEKARLALALVAWQKPNLLILDEPTNHLDMEVRDALLLAMQNFAGAVLLVSHDRYLLRHTVDNFWLVSNGGVNEYNGDLADYQKAILALSLEADAEGDLKGASVSKKDLRQQAAQLRKQLAPLKKQVTKLEREMAKHEQTMAEVETLLADPSLYEASNKDKLPPLLLKQGECKQLLTKLEEQWLEAEEQLQQLEESLHE